jgi:hypothetical protein
LGFATLRAALNYFEQRYLYTVASRFAELDQIEARIAEASARAKAGDVDLREQAGYARARAERSEADARSAAPPADTKFAPSARLQALYRDLAKRLHPDLTTEVAERVRRTRLMAEVNVAYASGDEARLQALLDDCENMQERPDGTIGTELVRVIRKIAQAEERIRAIHAQENLLKSSELYQIKMRVDAAQQENRDLLLEMAHSLDRQIDAARCRLAEIATSD